MADKIDVKVTGKSEAEIAYALFQDICNVEGRSLYAQGSNPADRDYIIKAFSTCMIAVKRPDLTKMT